MWRRRWRRRKEKEDDKKKQIKWRQRNWRVAVRLSWPEERESEWNGALTCTWTEDWCKPLSRSRSLAAGELKSERRLELCSDSADIQDMERQRWTFFSKTTHTLLTIVSLPDSLEQIQPVSGDDALGYLMSAWQASFTLTRDKRLLTCAAHHHWPSLRKKIVATWT